MPQATLRVKSNDGLVALSEAHPSAPFDVLGAWPDGEELRLLVETDAVDADALQDTLEQLSDVSDFEFRQTGSQRVLFELVTTRPEPHGAMAESGVVPSFPLHVEGGWIVGDLVASREQLVAFRNELRAADIEFRMTRLAPRQEPSRLLTDRQREVVDAALEHGYYETPRECTLTELAGRLEVNKSVVSRVLHRAESQIVTAHRSTETTSGEGVSTARNR